MAAKTKRVLPIRTVFYRGRQVVRIIAAGKSMNAVGNCTHHLRKNAYEATHAEVYDTSNGTLYAVMKRDVRGNMRIVYEAPPTKEELK